MSIRLTANSLASMRSMQEDKLEELRQLEIKLFLPSVQLFWESNGDEKQRREFNRARTDILVARNKIENTTLEGIARRLEENNESLQQGIDNLNSEIERLDNLINILSTINQVAGILSRIILLV